MDSDKIEFLRLHVINGVKYEVIAKQLNVSGAILTSWYDELKFEREAIAKIKSIWNRKKFSPLFEDFYNWHKTIERKCEYCGINEDEIKRLLAKNKIYTKRIITRGKNLEFDRKRPNLEYNQLDNIVLCCYWCNNAKTDEFSYDEFKQIGEVLSMIWKKRLEA